MKSLKLNQIPTVDVSELNKDLILCNNPFLIKNFSSIQPNAKNWTPDYFLRNFYDLEVSVAKNPHKYILDNVGKRLPRVKLKFGDFIEGVQQQDAKLTPDYYYLSNFDIFNEIKELKNRKNIPEIIPASQKITTSFWLSPKNACSPLHYDLPDNFLYQIYGSKEILLIDPIYAKHIPKYPWHSYGHHISTLDLSLNTNLQSELLNKILSYKIILEKGDAIFIPSRWWHFVKTLDTSISLNYWWQPKFRSYHPKILSKTLLRKIYVGMKAAANNVYKK